MVTSRLAIVAISVVMLAGCEGMQTAAQNRTVQGAALGTALGAGAGAILGNQTGHAGAGTAIGAALGALGGGLVGSGMQEQDRKIEELRQQQGLSPTPATSAPTTSTTTTTSNNALPKFCPVGGESYPENVKYCPLHGVVLRYKEAK